MRKIKFLIPVMVIIFSCFATAELSAASSKLLRKSDLEYLGAFRVPVGYFGSPKKSDGFNYGGGSLTYNPHNNSLFIVGNTPVKLTAEISIPDIVKSTNINDLNTATVLQNFNDTTDGNASHIGEDAAAITSNGTRIGGYLVWGDRLIGTVYAFYDASHEVMLSHFTSDLNLSIKGDFKGMFQVGETPSTPNPAFVDGYMGTIPPEWQTQFGGPALTGNCCLSIIGRTSWGPAASVFDPDDLEVKYPVPVTPVVGYPVDHPTLGLYNADNSLPNSIFNGSMEMHGIVFPQESRSVLFFGNRGVGPFCYGKGTSNPDLETGCDPDHPEVPCCYDPVNSGKGWHSYPYAYQVIAYDALDLLSVKNGEKEMWEIVPYDLWEPDFPFGNDNPKIIGAAYDPATQRIYLSEGGGDTGKRGKARLPLIQVYHVNTRHTALQSINMMLLLDK